MKTQEINTNTYIEIPAASVPAGQIWDIMPKNPNAEQSIEIAYARHESVLTSAVDGAVYRRVINDCYIPAKVTYFTIAIWTTYGDVRGRGADRLTFEEVSADLYADRVWCERDRCYNDRVAILIADLFKKT